MSKITFLGGNFLLCLISISNSDFFIINLIKNKYNEISTLIYLISIVLHNYAWLFKGLYDLYTCIISCLGVYCLINNLPTNP